MYAQTSISFFSFLQISIKVMLNDKPSIKSSCAFRTYDLLLGALIVFIAVAYALINLYLYKHIPE